MRSFLDEIKNEGFKEGKAEGRTEGRMEALEKTARNLFDSGMAIDKIAKMVDTSMNIVEEWLSAKKCETAK